MKFPLQFRALICVIGALVSLSGCFSPSSTGIQPTDQVNGQGYEGLKSYYWVNPDFQCPAGETASTAGIEGILQVDSSNNVTQIDPCTGAQTALTSSNPVVFSPDDGSASDGTGIYDYYPNPPAPGSDFYFPLAWCDGDAFSQVAILRKNYSSGAYRFTYYSRSDSGDYARTLYDVSLQSSQHLRYFYTSETPPVFSILVDINTLSILTNRYTGILIQNLSSGHEEDPVSCQLLKPLL